MNIIIYKDILTLTQTHYIYTDMRASLVISSSPCHVVIIEAGLLMIKSLMTRLLFID